MLCAGWIGCVRAVWQRVVVGLKLASKRRVCAKIGGLNAGVVLMMIAMARIVDFATAQVAVAERCVPDPECMLWFQDSTGWEDSPASLLEMTMLYGGKYA